MGQELDHLLDGRPVLPVDRTYADKTADGPVWSFKTAGTAPNDVPPSVAITAPANNASFTAPATISITATASEVQPGLAALPGVTAVDVRRFDDD